MSSFTTKKLDKPRNSIKIPIFQGICNQLGENKHRHSNLYPTKVTMSHLNGKQQTILKIILFKAEMYKGELNNVKESLQLFIILQVLQGIQQWLKSHSDLFKLPHQFSNYNDFNTPTNKWGDNIKRVESWGADETTESILHSPINNI